MLHRTLGIRSAGVARAGTSQRDVSTERTGEPFFENGPLRQKKERLQFGILRATYVRQKTGMTPAQGRNKPKQ